MENKIRTFTDLNAWQEGHKLVLEIYKITKTFPKEELFVLSSQIRRAAISITSNVAEGFSRQYLKEKRQFYAIALGSITEIQNQLILAKDLGCLENSLFNKIFQQSVLVHKLINGLVKSANNHPFHNT